MIVDNNKILENEYYYVKTGNFFSVSRLFKIRKYYTGFNVLKNDYNRKDYVKFIFYDITHNDSFKRKEILQKNIYEFSLSGLSELLKDMNCSIFNHKLELTHDSYVEFMSKESKILGEPRHSYYFYINKNDALNTDIQLCEILYIHSEVGNPVVTYFIKDVVKQNSKIIQIENSCFCWEGNYIGFRSAIEYKIKSINAERNNLIAKINKTNNIEIEKLEDKKRWLNKKINRSLL